VVGSNKSDRFKELDKLQKKQNKIDSQRAKKLIFDKMRKKIKNKKDLNNKIEGYNFDGKKRIVQTKFGERLLSITCECEYDIWSINKTELIAVNKKGDETWECGECKLNWLVKRINIDIFYKTKEDPKWNIYGNLNAKPLIGFFSKLMNNGRFNLD
jgi:hypothetical protein